MYSTNSVYDFSVHFNQVGDRRARAAATSIGGEEELEVCKQSKIVKND
jgi:hypothetical protein